MHFKRVGNDNVEFTDATLLLGQYGQRQADAWGGLSNVIKTAYTGPAATASMWGLFSDALVGAAITGRYPSDEFKLHGVQRAMIVYVFACEPPSTRAILQQTFSNETALLLRLFGVARRVNAQNVLFQISDSTSGDLVHFLVYWGFAEHTFCNDASDDADISAPLQRLFSRPPPTILECPLSPDLFAALEGKEIRALLFAHPIDTGSVVVLENTQSGECIVVPVRECILRLLPEHFGMFVDWSWFGPGCKNAETTWDVLFGRPIDYRDTQTRFSIAVINTCHCHRIPRHWLSRPPPPPIFRKPDERARQRHKPNK